jgi:hypothetical protein
MRVTGIVKACYILNWSNSICEPATLEYTYCVTPSHTCTLHNLAVSATNQALATTTQAVSATKQRSLVAPATGPAGRPGSSAGTGCNTPRGCRILGKAAERLPVGTINKAPQSHLLRGLFI